MIIKNYIYLTNGVAAMESAFIFPVLIILMLGIIDIGQATLINTKVITASQMASDLLTRENQLSSSDISEAQAAARAALEPYNANGQFGIDIVGILYDEESAPEVDWRVTSNMTASENIASRAGGLGQENDGVIIVTVEYRYTPRFSSFVTGQRIITETAFARGRDSAYVGYE